MVRSKRHRQGWAIFDNGNVGSTSPSRFYFTEQDANAALVEKLTIDLQYGRSFTAVSMVVTLGTAQ